nr:hypothetical protein [Streptomyces sp. 846.5]
MCRLVHRRRGQQLDAALGQHSVELRIGGGGDHPAAVPGRSQAARYAPHGLVHAAEEQRVVVQQRHLRAGLAGGGRLWREVRVAAGRS